MSYLFLKLASSECQKYHIENISDGEKGACVDFCDTNGIVLWEKKCLELGRNQEESVLIIVHNILRAVLC